MKRKTLISIALILAISTIAATSMQVQAHTDPLNYVKFFLWSTPSPMMGGSNVFTPQPPGTIVPVFLLIDSPAAWHDTAQGIVGVTASLRVDPNVVTVVTAAQMPDNNWDGRPDSFLGNYAASVGYNVLWVAGSIDAATGTIAGPAEAIQGFTTLGRGAGGGPAPLFRFAIQTKSGVDPATAYSLLHLFDCYYTTPDGVKHRVQVLDDGYYGSAPQQYFMSGPPTDPTNPFKLQPITDPIGTTWHELYPTYCNDWTLTSWSDNGDGYLSASDQIDMTMPGRTVWFHVDAVTVTIHWTFKEGPAGPTTDELGIAELPELTEALIDDPVGTGWHQIYPVYSEEFVITSWEDNGDGFFSVSDQFDFEYLGEGVTYWAHLDDVTVDIFLSFKSEEVPEFPFGLGLIVAVAPAIPIVYLWRTRKKEVEK